MHLFYVPPAFGLHAPKTASKSIKTFDLIAVFIAKSRVPMGKKGYALCFVQLSAFLMRVAGAGGCTPSALCYQQVSRVWAFFGFKNFVGDKGDPNQLARGPKPKLQGRACARLNGRR